MASRIVVGAVLLAALGASLSAAPAGAVVVRQPGGPALGVEFAPAPTAPALGIRAVAGSRAWALRYHGGPVLHSSAPYLVFWDPGGSVPGVWRSLLTRYFSDVASASGAGSNVYSVDRQFTDATGFADYRQFFNPATQVLVDRAGYRGPGCRHQTPGATVCITDQQIRTELVRLVAANGWPRGLGPGAPVYVVVLPPNVDVCAEDGSCADSFCAYHTFLTDHDADVLYIVAPSLPIAPAQNPKGCQLDNTSRLQQPNGTSGDLLLASISHEDSEVITDPLFNGWFISGTGIEDGDICSTTGPLNPFQSQDPLSYLPVLGGRAASGSLYDQVINGGRYYLQSEWSNGAGNCAMRPAASALRAAFSVSTNGTGVTLDPSGSASSHGYSSVTWSLGDGTPPVFRAQPSGPGRVTHVFAAAGTYSVSLTVVDKLGNLATARARVSVGSGVSAHTSAVASAASVHPRKHARQKKRKHAASDHRARKHHRIRRQRQLEARTRRGHPKRIS